MAKLLKWKKLVDVPEDGKEGLSSESTESSVSTKSCRNKESETRKPYCALCQNHDIRVNLKGHKRYCPYKTCPCDKCLLTIQRRKINAKQIALRREFNDCFKNGQKVSDGPPSLTKDYFGLDLDMSVAFLKNQLNLIYSDSDLVSILLKAYLKQNEYNVARCLFLFNYENKGQMFTNLFK